jgi:hypothetical protein
VNEFNQYIQQLLLNQLLPQLKEIPSLSNLSFVHAHKGEENEVELIPKTVQLTTAPTLQPIIESPYDYEMNGNSNEGANNDKLDSSTKSYFTSILTSSICVCVAISALVLFVKKKKKKSLAQWNSSTALHNLGADINPFDGHNSIKVNKITSIISKGKDSSFDEISMRRTRTDSLEFIQTMSTAIIEKDMMDTHYFATQTQHRKDGNRSTSLLEPTDYSASSLFHIDKRNHDDGDDDDFS